MDVFQNKRKVLARLFKFSVSFILLTNLAYAGQITYPTNPYMPGDPLTAADLNAKLNEIKANVNDNDLRIPLPGGGGAITINAINIDFGNRKGVPAILFPAASTQTGTWYYQAGFNRLTPFSGLSSFSVTTGAIDGLANGTIEPVTDNERLLWDNFFSNSGTWTVKLSGITNGNYTLYLYAPSHTTVSTGDISVNGGAIIPSIPGEPTDIFTLNVSYLVSTTSITNNTLTITGSSASFSGLAALQLIPI